MNHEMEKIQKSHILHIKTLFFLLLLLIMIGLASSVCAATNSLTIPEHVTVINAEAFAGDASLEEVLLPEHLESIESRAFADSSVKSVYFPASINYIAENAFEGSPDVTGWGDPGTYAETYCNDHQIPYMASNESLKDFVFSFTSPTEATLVSWTGEGNTVVVPAKADATHWVTAIGPKAFYSKSRIEHVDLPDTVRLIDKEAFWNCSKLTSIRLPRDLEVLGNSAFSFCSRLKQVVFNQKLKTIYGCAFGWCESLESADLPDSVESFILGTDTGGSGGLGVFYHCSSLSSFHYPKNLKRARGNGENSSPAHFQGCEKLTSIIIPEGTTMIPAHMFDCFMESENYISEISLPSTLETIQTHAFSTCTRLQEIRIPDSIISIAEEAFWHCYGLKQIYIPATLYVREYYPRILPPHWYNSNYDISDVELWTEYGASVIAHAIQWDIPYYYISLINEKLPRGNLFQGDYFSLNGLIYANENLRTVKGIIRNAEGTDVSVATVHPGSTEYRLSGSFCSQLHFELLQNGSYMFYLIAETDRTTVTLAVSSFTVKDPPPDVRLTGFHFNLAFAEYGTSIPVKGHLSADFDMDIVTVSATEKGGQIYQVSAEPHSREYDLSNLNYNFNILPPGDYTICVTIEGNSQTYVRGKGSLLITEVIVIEPGSINEDLLDEFIRYSGNKRYFAVNWPQIISLKVAVVEGMSGQGLDNIWEGMSLFLSNFSDALRSIVRDLTSTTATPDFYLNMAKEEIRSLISDIDESNYDLYGYDPAIVARMMNAYRNGQLLIASDVFGPNNIPSWGHTFIGGYNTVAEGIQSYPLLKDCELLTNTMNVLLTKYVQGMCVLDWLRDNCSYVGEYSGIYIEAIMDLRDEYEDYIINSVFVLFDYVNDMLIDNELEAASIITLPFHSSKVFSLATFFYDKALRVTGAYDAADDFVDFLMQTETYSMAEKNYQEAFDAVTEALAAYEADEAGSLQAGTDLEKLNTAKQTMIERFDFTLLCARRCMNTLWEMKRNGYSYLRNISIDTIEALLADLEMDDACPFRNQ